MKKRAFITGITGQDGSYLAQFLLKKEYEVVGLIGRRTGYQYSNLDYLQISERVSYIHGDMADSVSITRALKEVQPHEIYNLAAMSFVGLSWSQPIHTTTVDALGPLYLLEGVKEICPNSKIYQASTSEMFGNSMEANKTQNENTPFRPRSPYAFSKVFAHNAFVNYRESYGMFASNGICFNHESPIRGLEFVTRKITDGVAKIYCGKQQYIELGNLNSRRDWGFAGDYVKAMWLMLQQDDPEDFVIATGKTWSIEDLLTIAFKAVGESNWKDRIKIKQDLIRPAETYFLKGDSSKALDKLGWKPSVDFEELIKMMVDADLNRHQV